MARNLSKSMKRIVAGLCAVLVIAGAVPVQPIADVVRTSVIEAKAEATTYTNGQSVSCDDLQVGDILEAGVTVESVYYWVYMNGGNVIDNSTQNTRTWETTSLCYVSEKYEKTQTGSGTVRLSTPKATCTTPTANNRTYDTTAQDLVTGGTATNGTMNYAVVNITNVETPSTTAPDSGWSDTVPKETNAGTYRVWYKADGTGDYADSAAAYVDVTISKATPVATITLATSLNQNIIKSKSVTGGTLWCKVIKDGVVQREWTSGNISYVPTESGSYEVLYYIVGDDNYANVGSSVTPKSAGHLAVMPAKSLDLKAKTVSFGSGSGFSAVEGEGVSNLTDGNQETKLCVIGPTATSVSGTNYIEVEFYNDNTYFLLNGGYTMTTGNDTTQYPARNPVSWTVYGLEKGKSSYDVIGTITNNSSLGARDYSISSFNLNGQYSNKAFSKIKVRFTGCADTNTSEQGRFQLSEMFFDGKVMQNPTYSFTVNSAVTYDHNTHIAVSRTGVGGTIHYVYKKDNATTWTKYTGEGAPQFTDAGTYKIGWYSDIDFTNAFLEKGSETNPNVISGTFTINPYNISATGSKVTATATDQDYTGSDITTTSATGLLAVIDNIVDGQPYTMKEGSDKDYTVTYANNVNAGVATVTVTGVKNYTGSVSKTFNIRARLDLTDDQEESYAVDDQVRKAITKIEYDENGDGDYTDTYDTSKTETTTYTAESLPANELYYLNGKTIKITSNSKLTFKQVAAVNGEVSVFAPTEDWDESKKEYYYTFTIPTGVNTIKVYRVYQYEYNMLPDGAEYRHILQANDYNNYVVSNRNIAVLNLFGANADTTNVSGEYIKKLKTRINIVDPGYELPIVYPTTESGFEYFKKNDQGNYVKVKGVPSDVGEYRAKGTVKTNGADYYLEREFKITARPYNSHKTEIKPVISAIGDTGFTGEAERKVIYSGNVFTPVITVTDTPNVEADDNNYNVAQTLVRGTDYELGYMEGETFVAVAQENDATVFGKTEAGTYEIVVKFKGNYSGQETLSWTIEPQELPNLTINANDTAYDGTAKTATVSATSGTLPTIPEGAKELFTIEYYKGETKLDGAPVDVGTYKAKVTVNNTNYKFATTTPQTDPAVVDNAISKEFTISPKAIDITPNAEQKKTYGEADPTFTYTLAQGAIVERDTDANIDFTQYLGRVFGDDTADNHKYDNAGTYDFVIIGADADTKYLVVGNYKIKLAAESPKFTIEPKKLTEVEIVIDSSANLVYDGTEKRPGVTVKDKATGKVITDAEYSVAYAENLNAKAKSGKDSTITVSEKAPENNQVNNYVITNETAGLTKSFEIAQKPITDATITITTNGADPVYDGEAKQPAGVTVKDTAAGVNTDLTAEEDYTVTYENNTNASDAAVVKVTGKGNYTGENSTTAFSIRFNLIPEADAKDLITKVEYSTDNGSSWTAATADNNGQYNLRTGWKVKVTTKGLLNFTNTKATPATNSTSAGRTYVFEIKDGENQIKVSHPASYTLNSSTDATTGDILIQGVDNAVTPAPAPKSIAKLHMNKIYYLDNINDFKIVKGSEINDETDKIYLVDLEAEDAVVTVDSVVYEVDETPNGATIKNGKPATVGNYTVTIKVNVKDSKNNNHIDITKKFTVEPRPYTGNESEITITAADKTYTEAVVTTTVTVTDSKVPGDNKTLTEGTDYEVTSGYNGTNAGEYTATIIFKGNYTGEATAKWNIKMVTTDITNDLVKTAPADVAYNGDDHYQEPTLKYGETTLVKDADYTLEYTGNNYTDAGEKTVTVKPVENTSIYTFTPFDLTYKITPKALDTVTVVTSGETFTYDGNKKTFGTVTVKDGEISIDPSEYTVTYTNNVNAGVNTAKLTITDAKKTGTNTGNYTITATDKTFSIAKADITDYTAPTAKEGLAANGKAQALISAGSSTQGTMQYKLGDGAWGTTIPTATENGTHTVYWRIVGDDNHNDKAEQSITVKILENISNVVINPTVTPKQDGTGFDVDDGNNNISSPTDYEVTTNDNGDIVLKGNGEYGGEKVLVAHIAAKSASCTVNGNKEYWKSETGDNKLYAKTDGKFTETTLAAVTIKASGHTTATRRVDGEAATYDKDGYYYVETYCTKCYTVISRKKVTIPKLTHDSVEDAEVTLTPSSFEYDGTEKTPEIKVTLDEKELVNGTDYEVSGDVTKTEAGKYTVTIKGIGDYEGETTAEWEITSTQTEPEEKSVVIRARNAYFTGRLSLVMKFILPEEVTSDPNAYVVYSWKEGSTEKTEKKLVSKLETGVSGEDSVYLVESPVYAPEMENKVNYKFFSGNGEPFAMTNVAGTETYADGYDFSLRDYLELAGEQGNATMKALADAAFDYGVAAQIHFKYGDYQNLKVSDAVKAVSIADLEKYKLTESGALPELISNVKYSVEFGMDNTLRVKFNFKKVPTDAELKTLSCTIDGKAAKLEKLGDKQYALVVKNIAAAEIDTAHTFKITDGTNTYTTVRSALSYSYSVLQSSGKGTLVDLAKAFYLYNKAANKKFGV